MPESLLAPFAALRPDPARVAEIIAPPYDVVSTEEARALAARQAVVVPSRIEAGDRFSRRAPTRIRPEGLCAGGRRICGSMVAAGALRRDPRPAFYAYRLIREGRAADRRRARRLGRGLPAEPHPPPRADPPGQGGRPGAPDRGGGRPHRPGLRGASAGRHGGHGVAGARDRRPARTGRDRARWGAPFALVDRRPPTTSRR